VMDIKNWNRLRRIKEATRPVDAIPLFKAILDVKDENREKLKKDMEESFEVNGKLMLERAFLEKVLTSFEYADICTKYGLDDKDFGSILMAYFGKNGKDKIKMLTMAYSNVYKARGFVKERFGVDVIDAGEFLMLAKKEDPELFRKYMEENKISDEKLGEMVRWMRRDRKEG